MMRTDKNCRISFAGFIDDRAGTRIPATQVTVTKAPSSGSVKVSKSGLVYTPKKGFSGSDSFCTTNTSPKVPGQTLSGCVTITVQ